MEVLENLFIDKWESESHLSSRGHVSTNKSSPPFEQSGSENMGVATGKIVVCTVRDT